MNQHQIEANQGKPLPLIVVRTQEIKQVSVSAGDAVRLKVAWGLLTEGEIGVVQGSRHGTIEPYCQVKFRYSAYRDDVWCMVESKQTIGTEPKDLSATDELALIQFWRWSRGSVNAASSNVEKFWMYVPLWEWPNG